MAIKNEEALQVRGESLEGLGLNGIKLILVGTLVTAVEPTVAHLQVHFYNSLFLGNIATDFDPDDEDKQKILTVSGGHRLTAGWQSGQVHVASAVVNGSDNTVLDITISPIGDYSTYTLTVTYISGGPQKIDPILSSIPFKFRPGCFNIDCAPAWKSAPAPETGPVIDYLVKDYDSFKHTLINAMMERVPQWQATSEADLDQVLIDLFSAAADELSDFQDRVMNEAYLGTARKRVSLARHARLMDYHIHQGNQASTWLALELDPPQEFTLAPGFLAWTGTGSEPNKIEPGSEVFMSREDQYVHHLLNRMGLYTWSDSVPSLAAGSVSADLRISDGNETDAKGVEAFIRNGAITHLLIREELNPATGKAAGVDPGKRQVLQLLPGEAGAAAMEDPAAPAGHQWFVRVCWRETDKLKHNYCFTVDCPPPAGIEENISFFNGNLVRVYHGMPHTVVFKDPSEVLATGEYHYERTEKEKWGTICPLPREYGPLAYKNTAPGGETPPESTLALEVVDGSPDSWEEVVTLVHSGTFGERGDHFVVETDEAGSSLIRFGNGTVGKKLPDKAEVHCRYQVGNGPGGNIGTDKLTYYDRAVFPGVTAVWNPLDVLDGRSAEPAAEIIRRVPEAFRARQLRAVTTADYEDRAEELAEVSRAAARYLRTGSWRTVRVTIDPAGTTEVSPQLKEKVARHLEAVRLIGEDIEIRPPRWVPLKIEVYVCARPRYWPEDLKYVLDREFSEGYLPDGRKGFFHPDNWTFGQSLHTSQVFGRVQAVEGVDHIIRIDLKRFGDPGSASQESIHVKPNEIIRVRNNPDHMEEGSVTFFVEGGRT